MNETLELIKNRRSINQFKTTQISDDELRTIMEAAICAPNAMNQQKWHFAVIQNKSVLDRMVTIIKENMKSSGVEFLAAKARTPEYDPFYGAPVVVFISADEKTKFSQIDCSLAAQNIVLSAASLHIGSHIQTSPSLLFASEKGKELGKKLGIPDGYSYVCSILLGYPEGPNPDAKPRRQEVITYIK